MSLPISTIGAVAGAAKIAREVGQGIAKGITQGISGGIGFDDVLNNAGPDTAGPAGAEPANAGTAGPGEMASQLVDAVEKRLTGSGIDLNQDLPIRITDTGQLRIDGNHAQAAEIESILNSDAQIAGIAKQLAGTDQANGLTIPGSQGNIRSVSGGYPNW